MTPEHWPADVLDSWLWSLDASHFRVAFALIGLAARERSVSRTPMWGEVEVPVGGVLTTLDRLADRCHVTKSVVRRALDNLVDGPGGGVPGLIRLVSNPRGYTLAVLVDPSIFGLRAQPQIEVTARSASTISEPSITPEHSKSTVAIAGSAMSTAPPPDSPSPANVLRDGGRDVEHRDGHSKSTDGAQQELSGMTPGSVGGGGGSDRRSEISDPLLLDQSRSQTLSGNEDPEPDPKGRKPRIAADRIPEKAWKAADYLREQLLVAEPDNVIGRRKWEGTTGHRFSWANEFRLMNEQDGRDWKDIALSVQWLFRQTGDPKYRMRVESPSSLRSKWGAIQDKRKREAAPAPARSNPNQPAHPNAPRLQEWTLPGAAGK